MNDQIAEISKVLLELCSASASIIDDPVSIMHKYNMTFFGSEFNQINTIELANCLKTKFNIDIDISSLNALIPRICSSLNMEFEKYLVLADAGKIDSSTSCYLITLF